MNECATCGTPGNVSLYKSTRNNRVILFVQIKLQKISGGLQHFLRFNSRDRTHEISLHHSLFVYFRVQLACPFVRL